MLIRFQIPSEIIITGPTPDILDIRTEFFHKGLFCKLNFPGGSPMVLKDIPAEKRHARMAEFLEITVEDRTGKNRIGRIVKSKLFEELVSLLILLANRCYQAIRNYGIVHQLKELYLEENKSFEEILRHWSLAE